MDLPKLTDEQIGSLRVVPVPNWWQGPGEKKLAQHVADVCTKILQDMLRQAQRHAE